MKKVVSDPPLSLSSSPYFSMHSDLIPQTPWPSPANFSAASAKPTTNFAEPKPRNPVKECW